MRHPSLRSSACITLSFPSNLLAVYLCKGTHSPCVYTFSSRRNTARSYICRLPDFSSHLPFSLSSFSFFLSFFFLFAKNKEEYSALSICTCSFFGRRFPILSTRCFPLLEYSRRLCERFNLFSRHGGRRGEKRLGKGF